VTGKREPQKETCKKKEREKKNLAFRRVYSKNINLKSVKTRISS
jgi:hypothetical protein